MCIPAKRVGYARVSTKDQNLESQIDSLEKAKCDRIYSDKSTGRNMNREGFQRMLEYLRPGDTVVVWSILRLGRDMIETFTLIRDLVDRGIKIESLSHPVDMESAFGKFFVAITLAFGQLEVDLNKERATRGLKKAREEGRIGGRKPGERKVDQKPVVDLYRKKRKEGMKHGAACKAVAEFFPIGHATVARYAEELGAYKPRKRKS